MIYPFIYTRLKFHDYRVVTSKLLYGLPPGLIEECRAIARAMIDVCNSQLRIPSYTLVKNKDCILWGISCMNDLLGSPSADNEKRPVRGFFGLIITHTPTSIPFGLSYFKELYKLYVSPIWESVVSKDEVIRALDISFGDELIYVTDNRRDINLSTSISRLFPWNENFRSYIEAILSTKGCNSIATNIHKRSQVISIGRNDFSFLNVIMSSDCEQTCIEDVIVRGQNQKVRRNSFNIEEPRDTSIELDGNRNARSHSCKYDKIPKRCLRYCLYGLLVMLCLFLFFLMNDKWKFVISEYKEMIFNLFNAKIQ